MEKSQKIYFALIIAFADRYYSLLCPDVKISVSKLCSSCHKLTYQMLHIPGWPAATFSVCLLSL